MSTPRDLTAPEACQLEAPSIDVNSSVSRRNLETDILCATIAGLMGVIVLGLTWKTIVHDVANLLQMLGVTFFLVTSPGLICRHYPQTLSRSLTGFLVFLFCCAMGRSPESVAPFIAVTIAVAGYLSLGSTIWSWCRLKPIAWTSCIRISVLALLFVLVLIPYAWGFGNRNPLMMYGLVHEMSAFADNVYHAAIATMLDIHNTSSTGLDGMPYVHYHWMSHLMIACLASLTGTLPLEFYAAGYGMVILPFCMWCFFEFALAAEHLLIGNKSLSTGTWGYLVVIIGLSGFIIDRMWDRGHSRWDHNLMISESQVLGVAIMLLGVSIFLPVIHRLCFKVQKTDRTNYRQLLLILLGWCSLFAIIMSMKISSGHLVTVVLFPIAFLACKNKLLLFATAIASTVVMFSLSPFFTDLGGAPIAIEPLQYARKNFLSSQGIEFVILTILHPVLYSWLRIAGSSATTPSDVVQLVKAGQFRDVIVLWLVVGAGVAPMLLISGPMAFNTMYYHSAVQLFTLMMLAAVVSVATKTEMTKKWTAQPLASFAIKAVVVAILLASTPAVLQKAFDLVRDNLLCRGSAIATVFRQESIADKESVPAKLRGGKVLEAYDLVLKNTQYTEASMEAGRGAVIKALWELGQQPASVRSATALWIPKTNRQFWESPHSDFSRSFTSITAVSLAGMAMIDGYPEQNSANGYGFDVYPTRSRTLNESLDLKSAQERAASLGFTALVELQPEGRLVWHRGLD